jgi:hypothetical protein
MIVSSPVLLGSGPCRCYPIKLRLELGPLFHELGVVAFGMDAIRRKPMISLARRAP